MKNQRGKIDLRLELWERLTLALEKEGERSEFLTRVEDIRKDSYVLEMPVRQSGKSDLAKGDSVEVSYNKMDAAYTFKASIMDLFEGDRSSVEIKPQSEISRVQRRRFVRLDISGEISFRIIDRSGSDIANIGAEFSGSLLNISAGGVLFETQSSLTDNSIIVVSFSLKENEQLRNILALVKRAEQIDDDVYLVGAEFITDENMSTLGLDSLSKYLPPGTGTFDENLQKLLVQFVYRQQVDLKKKGLLSR